MRLLLIAIIGYGAYLLYRRQREQVHVEGGGIRAQMKEWQTLEMMRESFRFAPEDIVIRTRKY